MIYRFSSYRSNGYEYFGNIIVHGGPMFMAFMGNLCAPMYIPMNLYTIICLILIKIILINIKTSMSPTNQDMLANHEHSTSRLNMILQ